MSKPIISLILSQSSDNQHTISTVVPPYNTLRAHVSIEITLCGKGILVVKLSPLVWSHLKRVPHLFVWPGLSLLVCSHVRFIVRVLVCKAGDRSARNEPHFGLLCVQEHRILIRRPGPFWLREGPKVHSTVVDVVPSTLYSEVQRGQRELGRI